MDLHLLDLVRGKGGALQLSAHERVLLEFTLDQFGESLTRFLLTGLGEDETVTEGLFIVRFSGKQGVRYSRHIRVRADYRADIVVRCLPRQKEPLVMLALLWLLMKERQMSSFTLTYEQEEVLRLLGWEDAKASRHRIDEAVKRYCSLYYEWTLGEREMGEKKLTFYDGWARFVTGRGGETVEEAGELKRVSSFVWFDEMFVREMLSRSLFVINWNDVSSVERVTN